MSRNIFKGLSVLMGVLFLYGCAATKNVEMRRYVEDRERIDQETEGNAGYLAGTPQHDDRGKYRKTRRIYVVELEKKQGVEDQDDVQPEKAAGVSNRDMSLAPKDAYRKNALSDDVRQETSPDIKRPIQASINVVVNPSVVTEDSRAVGPSGASYERYTVQKDDTLQKISKKFYDSYSKWPKIYEANKDVIDTPDRIKPGIVIRIPMDAR